MASGFRSRCGESGCSGQRQHLDEESRAVGNAGMEGSVHRREGFSEWKDADGVNSLLCGPTNALKPPLMKPVITRAPLIKNETAEKQWANWGRRAL